MGVATERETWVGRSVLRVEDEALLRGKGRFMDDLEPVPHAWHAAIVRSQVAHARVAVDASAALDHPGVRGVLTGEDVASLSRPFPAGIESPVPHYAAAVGTARYVGEPLAVVVAKDRYLAEDAAELVAVDYEPLEPVVEPTAGEVIHERSFHYGDVDDALARADVVIRQTFRVPRFTCLPVECYGVVCDWDEPAGRLTAWANFQGPFTLHGVAAAALGLRADRFRLLTPPDSGGSFGIKAAILPYVVLVGLAARALGVPVRWTEDRLEHLAASATATGRVTELEAGFTSDGELVALRYDALEDVGAYVRAPEPATLYRMHGSLAGAYRVRNVAARNRIVLTNTIPSGLNRGFGGPQLYFGLERVMAIAARRLGIDPVELARRNLVPADEMPYRTPSGGLYDSGDYAACLDRAVELAGHDELRKRVEAAREAGRIAGIGLACVVEPSISNMGYITLAQTADERALTLPKSGNAEGASIAIDPHGGITVRRRQPQRGGTIVIGQARFGAGFQQQPGQICVTAIGGPLQRSGAIVLLCIHVGTAFQQTLDFRLVALARGIGNRALCERSASHGCGHGRQQRRSESFQCKATHSDTRHTRPGRRPVLSPRSSRWMSNWSRMLSSRLPVGTCLVGKARWRPPLSLPLLPPTRICGTS